MNIPESAYQAATDAIFEDDPRIAESDAYDLASNALEAALPLIRKQIAAEIQDMRVSSDGPFSQIHNTVVEAVADRIAEEGNTK